MLDLRTERQAKLSMPNKKKKESGGRQGALAASHLQTLPGSASHSSDGKKSCRKEASMIGQVLQENSLLKNDRFAFELSRGVGLEASVQTKNEVRFEGLLHSFGRQGEVVLCSALVSSGPNCVSVGSQQILDFVCIAKSDIVTLTIKNLPQSGAICLPDQSSRIENTESGCLEESAALEEEIENVADSEENIVPSEARDMTTADQSEDRSSPVQPQTARHVPDESRNEDRPSASRPQRYFAGPHDGRQFSGKSRKWHGPASYRPQNGSMERPFHENYLAKKEYVQSNWNCQRSVDVAASEPSGSHEDWRPHANFKQNSRYFTDKRTAPWTNSRHTILAPLSRPQPVDGRTVHTEKEASTFQVVRTAPSVDQVKNGHVEKELDLATGRSKSASVSSHEDAEEVTYRSSENSEIANPWTSQNVWHRRTALQGSRVLNGLAKGDMDRAPFVREDSDNQRFVNSFRAAATPLNPDAPEFQPRLPAEPEQFEEPVHPISYEDVEPVDDQLHQQQFYPAHMYPIDQQQMSPNLLPVSSMFLPLEVAQGHMQLFPHAAPPFFHTMSPNGEPQGIYVPLMPPLESYYASLLFHQMQAAHLAAAANLAGNNQQVPVNQQPALEAPLQEPYTLRTTPVPPIMENLMDEKEFPPLPSHAVEKSNRDMIAVNGMA